MSVGRDRFAEFVVGILPVLIVLTALALFVDWGQVWSDLEPLVSRYLR